MSANLNDLITVIHLVLESIFFTIASIVALLTYISAKQTIFQPIRAELFKAQLLELVTVLKFFVGLGEVELREQFAFNKLLQVNVILLYDTYARLFFDVEIDRDKRPYNTRECPTSIVTQANLSLDDSYVRSEKEAHIIEKPDPRVRAALWKNYEFGGICLPREYSDRCDELRKILQSPILPLTCAKLLEEYLKLVDKNTVLLMKLLTECAQELPEKYPTLEALEKSSLSWISNKYNSEFESLEPKAIEIINFARNYWSIDRIKTR